MSKGDWVRPRGSGVSKKQYDTAFEDVFGKKVIKTWNPEEDDEQEKQLQDQSTPEGRLRREASSPDVCTPKPDGECSRRRSGEAQESGDEGDQQ